MKSLLFLTLSALTFWAPLSHAQKTFVFGHGSPEDSPRHLSAVRFAERVAAHSGGALQVSVLPNAKAGDDAAMVAALVKGSLDLSANSQGAMSAVVPEYAAIGLPYLFSSLIRAWDTLEGPVGKELAQLSAQKGLIVLGYWDNGFRHMTNSKKPIFAVADLKGMKIRTPPDPVAMDLIRALGAQPVSMKFSELPKALRSGEVDGQENPLSNIYTSKMYEVQRYLTLTGHMYSVTPFVASKVVWDKLSDKDRSILRVSAREATDYHREIALKEEDRQLYKLKATGIAINYANPTEFAKAAEVVNTKWSNGEIGDFARKLIAAARQR